MKDLLTGFMLCFGFFKECQLCSEFARYFRGSGGIFLGERWNIFEGVVEYSWGRGEIFFGGWWNILIGSSIANVGRKG